MQLHGIRAKGKRRFKVTTDSKHDLPISPNLLNREFTVAEPDKVWVGDVTYIATDEGWLFLAVVIDLFSRQVVGWSLRHDMTRDIVIDALRMAWFKRHPSKQAGLMFHSDSKDFRDVLKEYGIASSMSRRGNCWDTQSKIPLSAAFDAGLCQPDEVRAELACQSAQASQLMISVMGYGFQGQGHSLPPFVPPSVPPFCGGCWRTNLDFYALETPARH